MKDVFVMTSDPRMRALLDELTRRGINAEGDAHLPERLPKTVLLPYAKFPSVDYSQLRGCDSVFAGGFGEDFRDFCKDENIRLVDWLADEELTLKNAHLTAEGAVAIALDKSPLALKDSFVTVLGYGRVARACVKLFSSLGAHVRVMARSYPARLDAYTRGCKAFCIADNAPLQDSDILINTIPSMILDSARLEYLPKDALIIELASAPYGIDLETAKTMGLEVIAAGGLPAKTAPKTAGKFMADLAVRALGGGV